MFLHAFICLYMLSYTYMCFHMLSYSLIRFYMLSYAFIRFYMLLNAFIRFYTLLYAFKCFYMLLLDELSEEEMLHLCLTGFYLRKPVKISSVVGAQLSHLCCLNNTFGIDCYQYTWHIQMCANTTLALYLPNEGCQTTFTNSTLYIGVRWT